MYRVFAYFKNLDEWKELHATTSERHASILVGLYQFVGQDCYYLGW